MQAALRQTSGLNRNEGSVPTPGRVPPTVGLVTLPSIDLLDNASFHRAGEVDQIVPSASGIYAIRLHVDSALPEPFASFLRQRETHVIYIGKATSLRSRMLGNELRGRGHGTFFRTIGAVLGHRPQVGSLAGKVNKNNFSYEKRDRDAIVEWINSSLEVAWQSPVATEMRTIESAQINRHAPLFNLQGNPRALAELAQLRRDCREIAST